MKETYAIARVQNQPQADKLAELVKAEFALADCSFSVESGKLIMAVPAQEIFDDEAIRQFCRKSKLSNV